jgi:hypothetical protein
MIGLLLCVTVFLVVGVLVPWPKPSRSVDMRLHLVASTDDNLKQCIVSVSNMLDSLVICSFKEGFKEPVIRVAYLSNSAWYPMQTDQLVAGDGVLKAHEILTSVSEIPSGVDAIKVGLGVTPLSWRGRAGWFLVVKCRVGVFASLGHWILSIETGEVARSRVEWTDPVEVNRGGFE